MLANPFARAETCNFTHENSDKSRPPGIETICTFTFFGKDFTIITQMCLLPLKHCSKVRMIHWLPASNTSPNSTCKKCLQKIYMQYSNPSGRKKNESSNSQLGQCGKNYRKLKPFATVHPQKTAVHRSNEAVQILSVERSKRQKQWKCRALGTEKSRPSMFFITGPIVLYSWFVAAES